MRLRDFGKAVAIDASRYHSIALTEDGRAWTWGYNNSGQLGDGTRQWQWTPQPVNGLTDIALVAAGVQNSAAVTTDGEIWIWGKNSDGQLGIGTTVDQLTPAQVPGISGVTAIECGWNFTVVDKIKSACLPPADR